MADASGGPEPVASPGARDPGSRSSGSSCGSDDEAPGPGNNSGGRWAPLAAVAFTAVMLGVVGGLTAALDFPLLYGLLAIGLQWGFFLFHAAPNCSEKFYDASGSLTHLAVILASLLSDPLRTPRQIVLAVMGVIWCTRLGTFLFTRIARDAVDKRFDKLKQNPWNFSIAWNFQILWVFVLQLPVMVTCSVAAASQPATGPFDACGWFLWIVGFLTQAVADAEKTAFSGIAANRGRFITTGLWRYSRHPNYFGEILMWVGICVSASSILSGWQWLAWLSPAFDAFLLLFVSGVPMLEKAGEAKWGSEEEYKHYMQNTSCIVPWIPAPPFNRAAD